MRDEFHKTFSKWGIRHFNPDEVVQNDGTVPPKDLWKNILPTLKIADQIRHDWGRPLAIVSGYRAIEYNTQKAHKGNLTNSAHQDFNAIELKCYAVDDPMVFVAWADAWLRERGKRQKAPVVVNGVRVTYTPNQPHPGRRESSTYGNHIRHGLYGREEDKMFVHIDTAPLLGDRGMEWDSYNGKNDVAATSHPPANPGRPVQEVEQVSVSTAATPTAASPPVEKDEKNEGDALANQQHDPNDQNVIFRNDEPINGTPFTLQEYLTPEELRRGIVAQVFQSNDWHLHQSVDEEKPEDSQGNTDTTESSGGTVESSRNLNKRQRYVAALVQAEFYRRRFKSRSVPAITGPFNPYPVPGFPGLIMDPARPILGHIDSVTHTIRVEGGQASTTVSISSPRYWDEGEVWYHLGGWSRDDLRNIRGIDMDDGDYAILYRRYPQWHNRRTVATNHFTSKSGYQNRENRRITDLDRYYLFTLGSEAVDYMSNHWSRVDNPQKIEDSIKERNPADLDVSPSTLDIREYNRMIAETKENGEYAPWTLANRFWGDNEPNSDVEAKYPIGKALEYAERYGVRERELMVEFLENTPKRTEDGYMLYTGPTFGGEEVNPLQKLVIAYMRDLEKRDVGGGTT